MMGVVEFDRGERERREKGLGGGDIEVDTEKKEAELVDEAVQGARPWAPADLENQGGSSDEEYEEVEVTDEDEDEAGTQDEANSQGPPKRQKPNETTQQPHDFNEDDIAYQLAAMGQDHGLDEGEYGVMDDESQTWEDGATGLPLTDDDISALFHDLLDDHRISPFATWDSVVADGRIVEDGRYEIPATTKVRRELFSNWSRDRIQTLKARRERAERTDPRIPYLAFLAAHATPTLYWPEFRRKFRKEAEMRDAKLSDKDREKIYREHVGRLKLPAATRKADLSALLKSMPLSALNRDSSLVALPSALLSDVRYISLAPMTRDPLIEAYLTTLEPAPAAEGMSVEEEAAAAKAREERERREKALAERQRAVADEKRRQRRDLEIGKGRLREEEYELERASRVGKQGLKGQLGLLNQERKDEGGVE